MAYRSTSFPWARYVGLLVFVAAIFFIVLYVSVSRDVKKNKYFGTVIPAVSADTIYDTSTTVAR